MLRRKETTIVHRKKQSLEEYEAQQKRENELKKKLEEERLAYLETLKPKKIEIKEETEESKADRIKPITFTPKSLNEEEAKPVKQHKRKRKMKVIYESDTDETE